MKPRASSHRSFRVSRGRHRLAEGVPFKGDHHELIFLFLYDVWVDLWGSRSRTSRCE